MYQAFIVLFAIGLPVCLYALAVSRRTLADERRRNIYAYRHFKRLQGSTKLWPGSRGDYVTYDLRSWDDGATWFAVVTDAEFRMTIKGAAEEVYPGLLSALRSMQEFRDSATEGSLNLVDHKSQKLLERTGFSVSRSNA